jgi:hypothetical protein
VREGVLVGVWDQGQGIPAGKLSLVFEEFQRLAEHSGMCSKGLGLGLAIVKRLATRLQHRLVVQSHYGRGSFFGIVCLMVRPKPPACFRVSKSGSSPGPSELQGLSVLLIDNEPAILAGMSTLLSGWGCLPLVARRAGRVLAGTAQPSARCDSGRLSSGQRRTRAASHTGCTATGAADSGGHHHGGQNAGSCCEIAAGDWAMLTKPVRPARLRALIGHLGIGAVPVLTD